MSAPAVTIKAGRRAVIVDADDAAFVRAGRLTTFRSRNTFYARLDDEPLHRRLLGRSGVDLDGFIVDHKNGDGLDNRRSNLRRATLALNGRNLSGPHQDNRSGYLGVSWHKTCRKWQARIKFGEKQTYLGYFDTPEAAHEARLAAEREHFGIQPRREWAHAA